MNQRRLALLAAAALVAATVTFAAYLTSRPLSAVTTGGEIAIDAGASVDQDVEANSNEFAAAEEDPVAAPARSAPTPNSASPADSQPAIPRSLRARVRASDNPSLDPSSAGREWTFADYRSRTSNPDAIDGQTAWEAYEFARGCVGQPRTEQQFEFQLEQYNQIYEQQPRRLSEQRFERYLDRLQEGFVRCQEFANADVVGIAAEWMQLAADLNYLPAQVAFYQALPALLRGTQDRVFREPRYLDLHRGKSVDYLQRAVRTGHPQAFAAMATALEDGVVFDGDAVAAMAYLMAAETASRGRDPEITNRRMALEATLSGGDVRRAGQWARGLCLQHCNLDSGS